MKNDVVVLAEHTGLGRVHLCDCSAVHVSLGPVTLNLAPDAFLQMAAMMSKAAGEFALQQAQNEAPETLFELLESGSNRLMH